MQKGTLLLVITRGRCYGRCRGCSCGWCGSRLGREPGTRAEEMAPGSALSLGDAEAACGEGAVHR